MTAPQRVQNHRKAEAARRQVRTQGKRVPRPRQPKPQAKPKSGWARYRPAASAGLLSLSMSLLAFATHSGTAAVGAGLTAAGGGFVAWVEYRRELKQVRRAGKPIGATSAAKPTPTPPASHSTEGLSELPEPKPVDLDPPRARRPAQRKPQAGQPAHPGCQASAPRYCRCPGRKRTAAKKTTTTKRTRKP